MEHHSNNKDSIGLIRLLILYIKKHKSTNDYIGYIDNIINKNIINDKGIDILYRLYGNICSSIYNSKSNNIIDTIKRDVLYDYDMPGSIVENISSKYISKRIYKYIENTKSTFIKYTLTMGIEYIIYFNVYDKVIDETYLEYIDICLTNIISIIHFLDKYRSIKCRANTLEIYLFLTDFKKILPDNTNTIIGADNVNTGMTIPCQSNTRIYIYRKEEYMKLVIHELIHALGIDMPGNLFNLYANILDRYFGIESTYMLNETYTELWALILNMLFVIAISNGASSNEQLVKIQIKNSLIIENLFSMFQANKILNFMGVSLENLKIKKKNYKFKEETHVFAYYILKYLLFCSLDDFLELNIDRGINKILNFAEGLDNDLVSKKCKKLISILITTYSDKLFLIHYKNQSSALNKLLDNTDNMGNMGNMGNMSNMSNTMRMTVMELA